MSFTAAGENAAVAGIIAAGRHICFFTQAPPTDGTFANEVNGGGYARQPSTFPTPAGGSSQGSQVAANIPGNTTITHWGVASAATNGTLLGAWPLPAQESFGSAGVEQFTPTISAV